MSTELLPLSMPSSTKTRVGLPESEPPVVCRHAEQRAESEPPKRAQRTLLGAGPAPEMPSLARASRPAGAPLMGAPGASKTLLGMPSEPPPPVSPRHCMPFEDIECLPQSRPSSFPQSLRVPAMASAGGAQMSGAYAAGSLPVPSARPSMASIADLPFDRPVLAAAGVAAVVGTWALMMLYLFAM